VASTADYQPMTLADLARHIAEALASEARVRRLVLEFLTESKGAAPTQRQSLLDAVPEPTGDARWDAFLGALAEHLAFHDALDCPEWARRKDRFLDRAWFLSNTPTGRAEAIVSAPASFMRRGVFIERRDLERV
jgi:hypothetical protein